METAQTILSKLQDLADPLYREKLKHFGIDNSKSIGIKMPVLRNFAKSLSKNQKLAEELWQLNIHECYILAGLIAEPKKMTIELTKSWLKDIYSWDVCDQLCSNLLHKCDFHEEIILFAKDSKHEFVKRTAFALIALIAVHHKKLENSDFQDKLILLEDYSDDGRNFVKKAISWAFRSIGKRNIELANEVLSFSEKMILSKNKIKIWIAKDVIKDLEKKYKDLIV